MDEKEQILEAIEPEWMTKIRNDIKKNEEELEKLDDWECDEEEYDDYLDEIYAEVDVAGCTYLVSRILKEIDEVRYEMGKGEYEDEKREERREELEIEIEELKEQLEE